jgi:hypothetical protein
MYIYIHTYTLTHARTHARTHAHTHARTYPKYCHIIYSTDTCVHAHTCVLKRHKTAVTNTYMHGFPGWPFAEAFEPTKPAAVGPTGRVAVSARCQVSTRDWEPRHQHAYYAYRRTETIHPACIHLSVRVKEERAQAQAASPAALCQASVRKIFLLLMSWTLANSSQNVYFRLLVLCHGTLHNAYVALRLDFICGCMLIQTVCYVRASYGASSSFHLGLLAHQQEKISRVCYTKPCILIPHLHLSFFVKHNTMHSYFASAFFSFF